MRKVLFGLLVVSGVLGSATVAEARGHGRGCYYRGGYGHSCYQPYCSSYVNYYRPYSYGCYSPYNYVCAYPSYGYSTYYPNSYNYYANPGISVYGPRWGVRVGY